MESSTLKGFQVSGCEDNWKNQCAVTGGREGVTGGDHWVEAREGADVEGGIPVGWFWYIGWKTLGSGSGGIPGMLYTGAGEEAGGAGVELR